MCDRTSPAVGLVLLTRSKAASPRLAPDWLRLPALGAGGIGEVLRGRDLPPQRDVATMVMYLHIARNPGLAERYLQEARSRPVPESAQSFPLSSLNAGQPSDQG